MSKDAGSCERANKTACVIQLSDKILTTYRRQAVLVYSAATKISRVLIRALGALKLALARENRTLEAAAKSFAPLLMITCIEGTAFTATTLAVREAQEFTGQL
jgi:hypothetical protein